jgi:hypothetical protein
MNPLGMVDALIEAMNHSAKLALEAYKTEGIIYVYTYMYIVGIYLYVCIFTCKLMVYVYIRVNIWWITP